MAADQYPERVGVAVSGGVHQLTVAPARHSGSRAMPCAPLLGVLRDGSR